MLNLLMRSNAFWTFRFSGFSVGSIPTSFLSKPLHLAILSSASILRLINWLTSLIRVKIFASEFFSINLKSSLYMTSMLAISSVFWSKIWFLPKTLFSSWIYFSAKVCFSSSLLSYNLVISSLNPLSIFLAYWSLRRWISYLMCSMNCRLSSFILLVFSMSLFKS